MAAKVRRCNELLVSTTPAQLAAAIASACFVCRTLLMSEECLLHPTHPYNPMLATHCIDCNAVMCLCVDL
jgi:hypothetical protein